MMINGEPILHLHVLIHDTSLELVDATINTVRNQRLFYSWY